MNFRSRMGRKLVSCLVTFAALGVLIGGTACSPPPKTRIQQAAGAAPGETKTLAVVAINSYEKILGDLTFIGALADMAGADQIAQAFLLQAIGDKGLAAIDKTRPWGVIVQTDGANFTPLGAIPVTKVNDLIAVAQAHGIQFNDRGEGLREVVLPDGQSIFLKPQGTWLLVGQSLEAFAQVPASLQADLTAVVANYDVAARVYVKNVPEMYKQLATMAMRGGMEQSMRRKPGESDAEFNFRREFSDAQIEELTSFFDEAEKLTFGMAVDSQGQRAYFDMALEAVPGSDLAKQMAISSEPRTDFGGFHQADAAATMTFANQVNAADVPELVAEMRANVHGMQQQLNTMIDAEDSLPAGIREAIKSAADDFSEALIATAETGKMDGGAAIRLGPDALTLIAGARVKQTDKVVAGLKKIDAAGKQSTPGFTGVAWDAAQHGDIKFHTLSVPLPPEADPNFRRIVGDQLPIAIGIGPEAMYLAVGRDNIETVKRAIDASRADANKKVPPFEVAFSLGPIMEFASVHSNNEQLRPALQNIAQMLKANAQGRDHIRIQVQVIENGARYRFEAEEGALKALVQAAMIAQMQQMAR